MIRDESEIEHTFVPTFFIVLAESIFEMLHVMARYTSCRENALGRERPEERTKVYVRGIVQWETLE